MALENLQTVTYIVISVIFALGTASIFLRLYCRVLLLKSFGWDDAMAVFLLVRRKQLIALLQALQGLTTCLRSRWSTLRSKPFCTCSCIMDVECE